MGPGISDEVVLDLASDRTIRGRTRGNQESPFEFATAARQCARCRCLAVIALRRPDLHCNENMRKVRNAEIAEVLAATPDDSPSRRVTENHQPFEIWLLEGAGDLGRVRMQLPTGECGMIAELHCRFAAWVNAPERTPAERDRYFDRCSEIENGTHKKWHRPIVLGPELQIHDGKHRLLAVYARAIAGGPLNLEVFWGCTEGCHSH